MLSLLMLLPNCARFPTYKYFVMADDYVEVDIKEPIVQECFEYGRNITKGFLEDFAGPYPIVLLHAWHRTTEKGEFYACEVLRTKIRYLITVNVVNDQKYLYSVRILNEEMETGAHWFHPADEIVNQVMQEIKAKYGEETELGNVAVFKTVMKMDTIAQMVIDCKNKSNNERMLIDVRLVKKFGQKDLIIDNMNRVY